MSRNKEFDVNQQNSNDRFHTAEPEIIPAAKDIEWADDIAADLGAIGESVAGLVNQISPNDPKAAYRLLGLIVAGRTGQPPARIGELLEVLADIHHDYHYNETLKEEQAA